MRPRLSMSCMAVSIHVRWGRPIGLGWPGMEFIVPQLNSNGHKPYILLLQGLARQSVFT